MLPQFLTRALLATLIALPLSPIAKAGPAEDARRATWLDTQVAFYKFFSSFVARNQAEVAAMFAPDAQFYGTASPEPVTEPEGVLQYFTAALDGPAIMRATWLQSTSTVLSDSVVLIAGMWEVERTLDGKTTIVGPLREDDLQGFFR